MPQRTRIINDPAELVPLFQAFASEKHMAVFRELADGWVTAETLEENHGDEFTDSIQLFKSAGLVKSNWGMGKEGPVKEYTTSYSDFRASFDCSISDIAELVALSLESETVLDNREDMIRDYLSGNGKRARLEKIAEDLTLSHIGVRALVKRSEDLRFHGNKVELLD